MSSSQRVAAYAVISDDAGRLLLTREPGARGASARWTLPGGGVEHGEHPEQSLIREIKEEAGLTATVGELRQVLSDLTIVGRRHRRRHNVRLVYAAFVSGAAEIGPGSGEARWCSAAEWRRLPLAPFTAQVLNDEQTAADPAEDA